MNRMTIPVLAMLAALAGCAMEEPTAGTEQEITVTRVPGVPSCVELSRSLLELELASVSSATYDFPDGVNSITVTTDGLYLSFSSTLGVDYAVLSGGPDSNVYFYPEAFSASGLHAPDLNEISRVAFCYDYELTVEKTANPSITTHYTWDIDKEGSVTELVLSPGQTYVADYTVTTVATPGDSGYGATGTITVTNNTPYTADVDEVRDVMDDGTLVPVDCPVTFPHLLEPGESFTCTYRVALVDASTRLNKGWAITNGLVKPGHDQARIDFSSATVDAVDDCIDVVDSMVGALGTVCAGDAGVFTYSAGIGPFADCGPRDRVNVASFTTNDTGTTGSDSWTVAVDVPCDAGCSLTPGYWKTHSRYGPAPYDDTWAMLPGGEDTPFFLSGQTYYEVLWTPPRGNAYYILAHAYIAAQLNFLNGASTSGAAAAFDEATLILSSMTPGAVRVLKGRSSVRAEILSLASILDDYNNGLIGPGHCDE